MKNKKVYTNYKLMKNEVVVPIHSISTKQKKVSKEVINYSIHYIIHLNIVSAPRQIVNLNTISTYSQQNRSLAYGKLTAFLIPAQEPNLEGKI